LTTEAGRSTTSPAAILLINDSGKILTLFLVEEDLFIFLLAIYKILLYLLLSIVLVKIFS
jgi:hypothetical protein